jgi:hypothetical protein
MGVTPTKVLDDIDLIPREDLATATGRSIRSLKRDWTLRRGPRPIMIGKKVFYRKTDVRAYVEKLARGGE